MREKEADRRELKKLLRERVVERLDLSKEVEESELFAIIDDVLLEEGRQRYINVRDKLLLRKDIFNSLRRYDVIQDLIEDDTVTELMVNGPFEIFYEREGSIYKYDECFESAEKLEDVVQMIAALVNRAVNESKPVLDARLNDGSRVNAVMSPIALNGPILTIRKFPKETMTMERLISLNALSREVAEFLEKLVKSRYNIFISGGTGSGKTTFLNALSNYVPPQLRMITIEDSAELQIKGIPNLVRLEAKSANIDGMGEIGIRALIKASLRMRPDILVIGEVRDSASIDMLQAMNTGHCGMSTGHANSPADMLSRLETMVLLGEEIPLTAVRKQIASALDIIVHLGRLRDKSRRVLEIAEVAGYDGQEVLLRTLYKFVEEGVEESGRIKGELQKMTEGLLHTEKLKAAGFDNNVRGAAMP